MGYGRNKPRSIEPMNNKANITSFKKGHKNLSPSSLDDWREKGGIVWNKGKKLPPEHIEKLKKSHIGQLAWNKGKRMPDETREKQSGENSHFWRGGVTPINTRIRMSIEYKLWRDAVFLRDDYTCQECGQRGGKLNADHIMRFADYPVLRLDVSNGRTLCVVCHLLTKTFGNKRIEADSKWDMVAANQEA